MADNSAQNATDTIRDKDRVGVKTQIFGLDLAVGDGTEVLMGAANPMPIRGATIASVSTNVPVATPTTVGPLSVAFAGNCTFIVKNTTAGSAWAGAPVLVFEQSDDSTSWAALVVVRNDTNAAASTFTLGAGAANAELMFDAALEGVTWVRCRVTTAPTTNPLTVVIQPGGGFFEPSVVAFPPTSTVGTPTTVAASATVVTLLVANAARRGYTMTNDSSSTSYLLNGTGASLTAYTVQIPAGGYYEGPTFGGGPYTGIVTGIWTAAIGNARMVEMT